MVRFSEKFQIFGKFLNFQEKFQISLKVFRFLNSFQIFGKFSDLLKVFVTWDLTLETLITFLTIENNNTILTFTLWPLNKRGQYLQFFFQLCLFLSWQKLLQNKTYHHIDFVRVTIKSVANNWHIHNLRHRQ